MTSLKSRVLTSQSCHHNVLLGLFLSICALNQCLGQEEIQTTKSKTSQLERVSAKGFKRLYRLNDSVYRSEQPSRKGFKYLESVGIKTVINFRRKKEDTKKAKGTAIDLIYMPLKTSELTEIDLIKALRTVLHAEKPLLVHCWHGSDRTGAVVAAYRIVFEKWSKEAAIEELRLPYLGYHEKWYPNVINLLLDLNVERVRKKLNIKTH